MSKLIHGRNQEHKSGHIIAIILLFSLSCSAHDSILLHSLCEIVKIFSDNILLLDIPSDEMLSPTSKSSRSDSRTSFGSIFDSPLKDKSMERVSRSSEFE